MQYQGQFADGTACMVWSPESQGEISKGIYVRGQGPETKSTEKRVDGFRDVSASLEV